MIVLNYMYPLILTSPTPTTGWQGSLLHILSVMCVPCLTLIEGGQQTLTAVRTFSSSEYDKSWLSPKIQKTHQNTPTAGEDIFACSLCDKKFTRSHSFMEHNRFHTEEMPFACFDCEKTFTRLSSLNLHQRTHTGEIICYQYIKTFYQL